MMRVSATASVEASPDRSGKPGASSVTTNGMTGSASDEQHGLHDQHQRRRRGSRRSARRRRPPFRAPRIGRHEGGVEGALAEDGAEMVRACARRRRRRRPSGPTPITAAMTTSRTKPVRRETSVQPPTERMLRSIGLRPGAPALVAHERVAAALGGGADALGDDVERPPLHLGEDAPDIFADDAERHELDAGEEHHRDDDAREAGNVGAEEQRAEDEVDGRDDRARSRSGCRYRSRSSAAPSRTR